MMEPFLSSDADEEGSEKRQGTPNLTLTLTPIAHEECYGKRRGALRQALAILGLQLDSILSDNWVVKGSIGADPSQT